MRAALSEAIPDAHQDSVGNPAIAERNVGRVAQTEKDVALENKIEARLGGNPQTHAAVVKENRPGLKPHDKAERVGHRPKTRAEQKIELLRGEKVIGGSIEEKPVRRPIARSQPQEERRTVVALTVRFDHHPPIESERELLGTAYLQGAALSVLGTLRALAPLTRLGWHCDRQAENRQRASSSPDQIRLTSDSVLCGRAAAGLELPVRVSAREVGSHC